MTQGTYFPSQQTCYRDSIAIYSSDGRLICSEKECAISPNPAVKNLYNITNLMNIFFRSILGLCGLDGHGRQVPLLIGWDQDNAQWKCVDGQCSMQFNDKYTSQPAVVGHEAAHGVVYYLSPLNPYGEQGALNESLGDVFGGAFNRWLVSENYIQINNTETWKIAGRDLSQPINMQSFKTGTIDRGYIHDNSLIPSHAYFLSTVSAQLSGYREREITKIWFRAFVSLQNPNTTFGEFALKTIEEAEQTGSAEIVNAVVTSWLQVKVLEVKQPVPSFTHSLPNPGRLRFDSIRS